MYNYASLTYIISAMCNFQWSTLWYLKHVEIWVNLFNRQQDVKLFFGGEDNALQAHVRIIRGDGIVHGIWRGTKPSWNSPKCTITCNIQAPLRTVSHAVIATTRTFRGLLKFNNVSNMTRDTYDENETHKLFTNIRYTRLNNWIRCPTSASGGTINANSSFVNRHKRADV